MSRKKRKLESFDVADFLRESDDDLKSALNSLLRSPVAGSEEGRAVVPLPAVHAGIKPTLVPAVEVDGFASAAGVFVVEGKREGTGEISPIPGIELRKSSIREQEPAPERPHRTPSQVNLIPGPVFSDFTGSSAKSNSNFNEISEIDESDDNPAPGLNLIFRHSKPAPEESLIPGLNLTSPPHVPGGRKKRQFPIREVRLAQDAHTRAEQQVYEALWENAKVLDEISKTITIGFGAMARMVRLSESNARINVRNLIAKLAMEEVGSYNCEYAIGRQYRIFNYSEIQRRRKQAGLTWYMRRTLAVIFVDPVTKEPLDLGSKKRIQQERVNSGPGLNLRPPPGPNLGPPPGPNLIPPYNISTKEFREELLRETSASSSSLYEVLSGYGAVDDDVVTRLRSATAEVCADYTEDELIHFVHIKGAQARRTDRRITNPIGFLLTAVPKCFRGESFQAFRRAKAEQERQVLEQRARQMAEVEAWRESQQAILDDPASSEEDKQWARKFMATETAGR